MVLAACPVTAENDRLVIQDGLLTDGAVMAPVRAVFTFLGYTLEWNDKTRTIRLEDAAGVLSVRIGAVEASYLDKATGESRTGALLAPPRYVGSTSYGPLTAMWRFAGIDYAVEAHTPAHTEFRLGQRHILVHHTRPVWEYEPDDDEATPGLWAEYSEDPTPYMTMVNKTDKTITVRLREGEQERAWTLPPNGAVGPRSMAAGRHSYVASAAEIQPASGRVTIKAHHRYTWTWYIVNR